jgi:hypothetical protein
MPGIGHRGWLLALPLLASGSVVGAADSASGGITMDGTQIAPSNVAAFRIRDSFAPRERVSFVMLTASPVERERIAADTDPYALAINDPAVRDADWLGFTIDAKGEVQMNARVGGVQYVDSSGEIMRQQGSLLAECRHNTAERVACHVRTREPVDSMDGPTWTLDVQFDTAVSARAAGTPLPADGGEPGKAFLAVLKTLQGNDLDAILAGLTEEEGEPYRAEYNTPEENLADAKQTMENKLPKQARITGGELVDANFALLEVEGVPYEGARFLYEVDMRRVEGRWRLNGASIAGMFR